jgi:hypothetical protein
MAMFVVTFRVAPSSHSWCSYVKHQNSPFHKGSRYSMLSRSFSCPLLPFVSTFFRRPYAILRAGKLF